MTDMYAYARKKLSAGDGKKIYICPICGHQVKPEDAWEFVQTRR